MIEISVRRKHGLLDGGSPGVEVLYLLCQMRKRERKLRVVRRVGTYRGNKGSFVVRPMKVCRGMNTEKVGRDMRERQSD